MALTDTGVTTPAAAPARPVLPAARRWPWAGAGRTPTRSGWTTAAIGVFTALLYTWRLGAVGYANDYYAAAVKAASVSWKAFFFGSIDPGNFITVDKPPAAFWVQALSVRVFGYSSWSMLLPEALAGVASVLVLHHLVRRWAGDTAAHLSALAFALAPVAVLMFRYNNPDALLTFLGLAAAWALWSAVETGRTWMLVLAAALTGLAFDTKMLQAFLVLPAFVLVYLVAGPPKLGRRIAQLAVAAATLLVSAGWWVAIVTVWPASSRPYIGSSSDNSLLSLIFGYNGLGRLFGEGRGGRGAFGGGGPPGGGGAGFGGSAGWLRMFNSANGGEVAWLVPLAVLGLVAGLWMTRGAARTDRMRAGWLLWGGWALVCYVVFSKAQGIYHPYYTVQLAPAVAALAGAGSVTLWKLGRMHRLFQMALPVAVVVTAAWAVGLLRRTPGFDAWLRPWVILGAALAAAGVWVAWQLRHKRLLTAASVVAAVTLLAGPAAYATSTVTSPQGGAIVAAGPPSRGAGFGGPGAGGLRRDVGTVDQGLIRYLEAHRGGAKYLVATFGSNSSAPIIIATGEPVVTIGGFNGGDPAPTLAQFQEMVARREVRYVLLGGGGRPGFGAFGGGPGGGTGQISQWVPEHGSPVPATAYGGAGGTLYELSGTA